MKHFTTPNCPSTLSTTALAWQLHARVKSDFALEHVAQQCLVQLASVSTTSFQDLVGELEYFGSFMRHLASIVADIETMAQQNPGDVTGVCVCVCMYVCVSLRVSACVCATQPR